MEVDQRTNIITSGLLELIRAAKKILKLRGKFSALMFEVQRDALNFVQSNNVCISSGWPDVCISTVE